MKNAEINVKKYCQSRAVLRLLMCCLILNASAPITLALEAIDVTSSSGVIGTQWGDHTIIDTDHGAIIDWSNFKCVHLE